MKKIRIGIICPSEIAFRRFMPALEQKSEFEYIGVAIANEKEWGGKYSEEIKKTELDKAQSFVDNYGGKIYEGYEQLIESDDIDAIYLPLPPALHFKWGSKVLNSRKHLFVEKPSTISATDTEALVKLAADNNLALHENYMFAYHSQLDEIADIVNQGKIGEVRLYRIAFGFPQRAMTDFRYNKSLGGGALLDCGGYTLKLANKLLGESTRIAFSKLNYMDKFEVDVYGSATLINDQDITAQISFGMDNSYKCDLEIWGSKGTISTGRIFTAPAGFIPSVQIKIGNEIEEVELAADDTFVKSISKFEECINNFEIRENEYKELIQQAKLVDNVKENN